MSIVICNVWCYTEGNDNLKLPEKDIWLPIAIDWEFVSAVKSNGEGTEFTGANKAVIYFSGERIITDLDFPDAVNKWVSNKTANIK